jgi:hypothetical protein
VQDVNGCPSKLMLTSKPKTNQTCACEYLSEKKELISHYRDEKLTYPNAGRLTGEIEYGYRVWGENKSTR